MADLDDEDSFPNDFDGLDFDSVPGLQPPTTDARASQVASTSRSNAPPIVAGLTPSPDSDGFEGMDSAFLAAVDALEARALGETSQGAQSLTRAEPGGLPVDAHSGTSVPSPKSAHWRVSSAYMPPFNLSQFAWCSHSLVRAYPVCCIQAYSRSSTESSSASRKGKGKAELQDDVSLRTALAGYEAELTCPICCDLLVGAQVTNPCGHTCCGACLHAWLQRNKYEPTCAVCRSRLSTRKPLLPNFSVDSLVHQHLQILARSGRPEWQDKGYKTIEWNKRRESWKEQVAAKAAKEKLKDGARTRRRRTRHYEIGDYAYSTSWSSDEDMVDQDAIVVHVTPRRAVRARR